MQAMKRLTFPGWKLPRAMRTSALSGDRRQRVLLAAEPVLELATAADINLPNDVL